MGMAAMVRDLRFTTGLVLRRPFDVLVQVTNRCNLKCSFCDFWPNGVPSREELTVADYVRIADELAELGCFFVSVEGGEPFLRPDLTEIVRAFARRHLPGLFTSGWYTTGENARALFEAGLAHVGVSIDYPDAARHDAKRGAPGTFERAWAAVEHFRKAAPGGGKQVHVITVVMEDNWRDLEPLLRLSAEHGVGHWVTLLGTTGYRRGKGKDFLPPPEAGEALTELWKRHPHLHSFRGYLAGISPYLRGDRAALPACRAGLQSFNIDHVGNVSVCIEKIDRPVGNVRTESLRTLHERLVARREDVEGCQECWSFCRGVPQMLGNGGRWSAWVDLGTRMRTW